MSADSAGLPVSRAESRAHAGPGDDWKPATSPSASTTVPVASAASADPALLPQTQQVTAVAAMLLLRSDVECPLCLRVLYQPVTTSCGHTMCRPCLLRSLDHASRCCLCRTALVVTSSHPVNVVLDQIVQKCFPDDYRGRKEEEERAEAQQLLTLPLFPLTTVLFPGMHLPLSVFEPRYRVMLRRCAQGSRAFGVVQWLRSVDSETGQEALTLARVGTVAQITDMKVHADGSADIETVGTQRFRILDYWKNNDGYWEAKIEAVQEGQAQPAFPLHGVPHAHVVLPDESVPAEIEPAGPTAPSFDITTTASVMTTPVTAVMHSDETSSDGDAPILVNLASPTVTQRLQELAQQVRAIFLDRAPEDHIVGIFGPIPSDPVAFSLYFAAVLPVDNQLKRSWLSMTDPMLRLTQQLHMLNGRNPDGTPNPDA